MMEPRVHSDWISRFASMVLLASAAALSGCATPTGYQERSWSDDDGYTDTKLRDREYAIIVKGNRYTTLERAKAIARLRAARLTLEEGYQRFAIIQDNSGVFVDYALGGSLLVIREFEIPKPTVILVIEVMPEGEGQTRGVVDAAEVERQTAPELK